KTRRNAGSCVQKRPGPGRQAPGRNERKAQMTTKVKAQMKTKVAGFALNVKLTFTAPLLGTVPKDPAVYANYIAANSPDVNGEIETLPLQEESGWTGFHQLDGKPAIYDYAIKGFCKDACSMMTRAGGLSAGLTAFKKVIDGVLFITPRLIEIHLSGELKPLERPLRAQTAQGERVCLARSD